MEVEEDMDGEEGGVVPEKFEMKPAKLRDLEKNKNLVWIIIVVGFVIAITTYVGVMMHLSNGQLFFLITIVLAIALLFLIIPLSYYTKQLEENEPVGIKKGWMITWMDRYRAYTKAPKETTLLLVYGYYRIYQDGRVESIPSTFNLTFYETPYTYFSFNPYIRGDWHIYKMIENEYGEIVWADGTDRYLSAFERDIQALEVDAP